MFEKDFITLYDLAGHMAQAHKEKLFSDHELSQLTIRQIYYIKCINQLKEAALGDLARCFKITKPSVTAIIQRLSEMGYVEKHQSPDDLRVFIVKLTPRGERLARVDEEAMLELCSQISSVLNEKEVEEFSFLLARLVTHLK
jgi:DNA-binding MarR family transcriptional regulator